MKELWNKTKQQSVLYHLAIIFCVCYSLDTIATAIVSVMIDTRWEDLDGTQKFIRVCLVIKAWASTMLAFFTNAAKKIQNNEFPLFQVDTEPKQTVKQTTTVQQNTVATEVIDEPKK